MGHSAFTLLELLTVLLIIGILSAVAYPTYDHVKDNAVKRVVLETAGGVARNAGNTTVSAGSPDVDDDAIEAAVLEAGLWDGTGSNDTDLDPADPWTWDKATNFVQFSQGSRCFEASIKVDTDGDGVSDWPGTNDSIDDTAVVENLGPCDGANTPSTTTPATTVPASTTTTTTTPAVTTTTVPATTTTTVPPALNISYASSAFTAAAAPETLNATVTGGAGAKTYSYSGTLDPNVAFSTATGAFTGPSAWVFGFTQLSAGNGHTCGVTALGGVKCWGLNSSGQLGDGTTTDRATPVDVSGLTSGVSYISAGGNHNCALKTNGELWCWGSGLAGRLGNNSTLNRTTPVQPLIAGVPVTNVTKVAAGGSHTCAVIGGVLKCWGDNTYGQRGIGTFGGNVTTPNNGPNLTDITSLRAGGDATCALKSDESVWCWGTGMNGQLGDGTGLDPASAVQAFAASSGVVALEIESYNGCALMSDTKVKCWGDNTYGGVGNNSASHALSPVYVHTSSVDSTALSGVVNLTVGTWGACATMQDGTAKCWGYNSSGMVGDDTTTLRRTPVAVSGLSGVASIARGDAHTCAIKTNLQVWCWGSNYYKQLANAGGNSKVPVQADTTMTSGALGSVTVTVSDNSGSANTSVTLTLS